MTRFDPFGRRRTSVPASVMSIICLGITAMAFLSCLPSFASAGQVGVDCAALAQWTGHPPVNQVHVFCGEWKHDMPRGFHSRPGGLDPETVVRFMITQPANAQGIYGGSWSYAGQPYPPKFSTMFPDACSMQQVLNSIVYAARHRTRCPPNAPRWAACGPNRPPSAAQHAGSFCDANDGTGFMIAIARLRNGHVNSAFPLR
jgi:Bacterial EndoU nuclease